MDVHQALSYELSKLLVAPFLSLKFHLRSEGKENVPEEEGALIVSNHRSLLDPLLIACVAERYINFAAGSFAFDIPVVGKVFSSWGVIPLNVFGGEKSKKDLEQAAELLRQGELVGVFPEGVHTLARPHRVAKVGNFRTGFARLALMAKVPLIPVAVVGEGERSLPRIPPALVEPFFDHPEFKGGVQWITYKRALVRIGKPIDLSPFHDEKMTKELIDRISGKVRRIVTKLYNGEDLDRFLKGEKPFDIAYDRV